MSYNFGFDRPDAMVIKTIREKEDEIEKLKQQLAGEDKEKDMEICKLIRNMILQRPMPDEMEHLTAALVNMRKVMEVKE